jgi:hypothetical protein
MFKPARYFCRVGIDDRYQEEQFRVKKLGFRLDPFASKPSCHAARRAAIAC